MSALREWATKHKTSIIVVLGVVFLLGLFIVIDIKEKRDPAFIEVDANQKVPVGGSEEIAPAEDADHEVVVHVTGAVENSGVYTLEEGDRVHTAVEMAKPRSDADLDALNLAAKVTDGEKIVVPKKGESTTASGVVAPMAQETKININTADKESLMQLSGIGEKRAEDIIKHRESVGGFAVLEDLQDVPGIGEKTFANLKDEITI